MDPGGERHPRGVEGRAAEHLVALDAAIDEAREIADSLGTSGAQAQIQVLEAKRDDVAGHAVIREAWLDENAPVLHRYSAVMEELQHRINGRVAAYELTPPEDVLTAIGAPPADPTRRQQWSSAVTTYAEARMSGGPKADLTDPAVIGAAATWRSAAANYRTPTVPHIEAPQPVLRPAM